MRNFGLTEIAEGIQDYILGGNKIPSIPYREDGNWEEFLPKYENQTTKLGQETSGCTVWGSQNQIETFYKGVYGLEPNYSERFTYNLVPIDPSKGTDPQRTHETIRKYGLVDDRYLPMTDSLVEYTDKSDITGSLLAKGQNWLLYHEYKHEWCWVSGKRPVNYIEILKEALKTSPIAVSVSAWNLQDGVYVSNQGSVNNHYCLLYKIDEEGYPWVFDSYDHSKKKLAKDHNIRRAKRIWLNVKTNPSMTRHIGILQAILNLFVKRTFMYPLQKKYPISQKFLVENKEYQSGVHNGTDYACPKGTPVVAPSDGDIVHIFRNHATMGNAVYFVCDDGKHYLRFLHLSEVGIRGFYKQGEVIGKTGDTGQSHGAHLHVDVWNVPFNTGLIKTKQGVQKYLIDPELFFTNIV